MITLLFDTHTHTQGGVEVEIQYNGLEVAIMYRKDGIKSITYSKETKYCLLPCSFTDLLILVFSFQRLFPLENEYNSTICVFSKNTCVLGLIDRGDIKKRGREK